MATDSSHGSGSESHSSRGSFFSANSSDSGSGSGPGSPEGSASGSESSSSSVSSSSPTQDLSSLRLKVKRQAQTAKARAASLAARATRRLAKRANLKPRAHAAEEYRELVQAENELVQPGGSIHWKRRRRLRLLVSYLKAWVTALVSLFTNFGCDGDSSPAVDHLLSCIVLDDTNMRLSQADPQVNSWKSSRIVSVMNVVQALVVSYSPASTGHDRGCKVFNVHTPLVCLPKADCDGLYFEFISRVFVLFGQVSYRFCMLGMASQLLRRVAIQGVCVCMDALATNQAVLKRLRLQIQQHHAERGCQEQIFPMLAVLCEIHGLALARKSLVSSLPGFWSSVVRLAHLFEVGNFRLQFRRCLVAVIVQSYKYIPVPELPPNKDDWRERHAEWCGVDLAGLGGCSKPTKRRDIHEKLLAVDNGDFESRDFTHFCIGSCCEGFDHKAKSRFALVTILRHYVSLFGTGFPVPLTYRWIHASRALQYLKDGLADVCIGHCHSDSGSGSL